MKKRWIVVADAGRARVLSTALVGGPPELVQSLQNPSGMQHVSEMVSDRPGRVDKRCGCVMSAMDPRTDPHEQSAIEFAQGIVDILDEAAAGGKFQELVLVAPAHFLGLLRHGLGPETAKRLILDLPRDLTRMSPARIAKYLSNHTGLRRVECDD